MANLRVRRGDVVVCVLAGDFGKPRPAVVVQSDWFNDTHASVTVCPLTTERVDAPLFRPDVPALKRTGLRRRSQVMVDKVSTVRRERVAEVIGRISEREAAAVDAALVNWLGLNPDGPR